MAERERDARPGAAAPLVERVSAGLILFRRSPGGLEVLLGHPGGPYFARKDLGDWSIPKGEAGPGEELEDVARREFEEEVGHPAPRGPLLPLGTIRQKGGKLVHAWAAEGDLDPATAVSNTFTMPWPPGSATLVAFPEVDRVAWFGLDEARRRIKEAQAPFVDRLVERLA
ncbi:MAG: NUDIX domain-containing protein [Chloroflexi bacterium]|nr:NUDIX domain-containing protein [Chloroflexota bacterium]